MALYSQRVVATVVSMACLSLVVQSGRVDMKFYVSPRDLKRIIREKLAAKLGNAATARIDEIKDILSPMVASLPKNEHGRLSHGVVRYALHRYFMKRYAWYIRGLDKDSDDKSVKAELSYNFTYGQVPVLPTALQSIMEEQQDIGLGVHELAIVASSVEDAARMDATKRLEDAYWLTNLPEHSTLNSSSDVEALFGAFALLYINGAELMDVTLDQLRDALSSNWDTLFSSDGRLRTFRAQVENARVKLDKQGNVSTGNPLDFNHAVQVADQFIHDIGHFNSQDCLEMKHTLLGMEGRKPGRVRLSDFYNASRYGPWRFKESVDYLRIVGALDDSNTSNMQVIVPNYVASLPQCLTTSGLYLLCCPNECEDILGTIESAIGAPEVNPEQLAAVISEIGTDTVPASAQAPRQLLPRVSQQLEDIASLHDGVVPIHGRLFAQWLHHAFPRECPYPSEYKNESAPLTPDEWLQQTGLETSASAEQMDEHIRPDDSCSATSPDCDDSLPWIQSEELLVARTPLVKGRKTNFRSMEGTTSSVVQPFVLLAVMAAFMYSYIAKRGLTKLAEEKLAHMV